MMGMIRRIKKTFSSRRKTIIVWSDNNHNIVKFVRCLMLIFFEGKYSGKVYLTRYNNYISLLI